MFVIQLLALGLFVVSLTGYVTGARNWFVAFLLVSSGLFLAVLTAGQLGLY
ncbi:hypothetical protein LCD36_04600 [Saccharopolyspora sp. 6T]|uniref:hypothetical protein n=1 Tax=Saccharopolyspora sp. 6T TaxID=2877238 RepID=UPI001CD3818E|nr:hypothetical protein [Saccharopolyspora sp. 6T]MCA1185732.1 hypothetical protein [Saccharopolyspora sp. 6T]